LSNLTERIGERGPEVANDNATEIEEQEVVADTSNENT
jgi:hypothetical protein